MSLNYPIDAHVLDNGMRVVVSEDHLVPQASLNLWVDVGSRHESQGRTGLAHLFEHVMFEGSQHVANGEHFRLLMGHGGHCNATTSFDRTTYIETMPAGALDLALWLEADRHRRLLPALTQQNLDNQRDVVVQEKHQRYDNQPYGDAFQRICRVTFPERHPYRHTPIGDMEDLLGATLEDVHGFYQQHYGASTTVLSVVGDVAARQVFERAEQYFGGPGDQTVLRRDDAAPLGPLTSPSWSVVVGPVPAERSYTCFRLPAVTDRGFVAGAMALDILAGLVTSSLHQRLVRRDESATACGAAGVGLVEGTSMAYLVVDVAPNSTAEAVDAAVCEELELMAEDGPTQVQHRAAVAGAERAYLGALADTETRAEMLARALVVHEDADHLNSYPDLLRSITPAEIVTAAQTWLTPQARAVVVYRDAPSGGTGSEDTTAEAA